MVYRLRYSVREPGGPAEVREGLFSCREVLLRRMIHWNEAAAGLRHHFLSPEDEALNRDAKPLPIYEFIPPGGGGEKAWTGGGDGDFILVHVPRT